MSVVARIVTTLGAFTWAVHATQCDLSVVGAGAGGAYAAWQAAEGGKKVCVFERSGRPGGRIHSLRGQGPQKDLVVEAGAYRFAPHEVCENMSSSESWCIFNPITASIVPELGLKTGVYDPDPKNWDNAMRILVDDKGYKVGYLTLVEEMLAHAKSKGADIHFNTTVRGIAGNGTGVQLQLDTGAVVTANAVLLNIPQRPLLKLLRNSGQPFSSVFPAPLYDPVPFNIMKLYVHYEDAWWRNYLGLNSGFFENNNTGTSSHVIHMHAVPAQSPAPLKGQYHDGDVRCDGPGGACRGYIQAVYNGGAVVDYFKIYHPWEGDSVVQLSSSKSVEHRELLSKVHTALVALHRPALDKANVTEKVAKMLPDSGVLSIWSEGAEGIHAGCHVPKPGDHPKPVDLPTAALTPFPGWPVYVANEAYGPVPCFAEGSLNMSSRALEKIGVPRPSYLGQDLLRVASHPPPSMDPFLFPNSGKIGLRGDHSGSFVV
jgi:hypothetical protein